MGVKWTCNRGRLANQARMLGVFVRAVIVHDDMHVDVFGGRQVEVPRLRVRSADGEVPLVSFQWAAATDPLDEHTLAAVAAGVSTRRYADTLDPVPADVTERATSSSAVSRRFVALSTKRLEAFLGRPLGELDLRVVCRPSTCQARHVHIDGGDIELPFNQRFRGRVVGSTFSEQAGSCSVALTVEFARQRQSPPTGTHAGIRLGLGAIATIGTRTAAVSPVGAGAGRALIEVRAPTAYARDLRRLRRDTLHKLTTERSSAARPASGSRTSPRFSRRSRRRAPSRNSASTSSAGSSTTRLRRRAWRSRSPKGRIRRPGCPAPAARATKFRGVMARRSPLDVRALRSRTRPRPERGRQSRSGVFRRRNERAELPVQYSLWTGRCRPRAEAPCEAGTPIAGNPHAGTRTSGSTPSVAALLATQVGVPASRESLRRGLQARIGAGAATRRRSTGMEGVGSSPAAWMARATRRIADAGG